jgi:hypothetical protein
MNSRNERKENQQPSSSATEEIVNASESDEGEEQQPYPTSTTTTATFGNPYKEGPSANRDLVWIIVTAFPGVVGSEEKDAELERESDEIG